MLPRKDYPPPVVLCPRDHLRMDFHPKANAYRCNLPGCPLAYATDKGYFSVEQDGDAEARNSLYAQSALCLCENNESHHLYIEDYVVARRVRFWVCPVHSCGYEVTQRLEKTSHGWRTCGSFEQSKPIRLRH
jgi:hypothetical protein